MSRGRPSVPRSSFCPPKNGQSATPPWPDKSIARISSSVLRGKISLFAEFLCWIALLLPGNKHAGHTDRQENWRSVSKVVRVQV